MNFEQLGDDLTADENKHWREVAEYERYTKPLLVRLRAVEWPALLALHSARWHRAAVEAIRARTPMHHYCSSALSHQELIKESQKREPSSYGWQGSYYNTHTGKYRQIQCYPLFYVHDTGTYPLRFCPSEGQPVSGWGWFRTSDIKSTSWTPEAHAWQSYKKAKELNRQVLRDIDAKKRSSPHRRQYLADCLRSSSQRLGRYTTQHYGSAGGFFTKETYELDGNLDKAIGGNSRPSYLGALMPGEFGEIEAKWEHFQQCLNEFLQAENPKKIVSSEKPAPQLSTSSKPTTDSKLVRDTYLHFPGVFEPFVGLDEREGLRQWAMHLADLWAGPRQHSAPSDYDAAYYNQSGDTRAEFLAALRRVEAAIWLALRAPGAERELFEGRGLIPDGESEQLRGEALMTLATRGTARLLNWLGWREQHPTRQLLTALGTIELANAALALTSREAERPACLFVPDSSPAVEAGRFTKLLAEFRQHLPSKRAKLRALLAELEPLRVLPSSLPITGAASELARFPMLSWAGRKEYPTNCTLAETFWPDLEQALRTRAEWAARACDVVAVALGENTKPEAPRPAAPLASPLLTPAATRTLYLKILEHPALVGELTAYQKSELRAYAEAEQSSANETAVFLMGEWPNYNYPAEFLNGREFDYWQAKVPNYADSGRVLHLLASPAPVSGLPSKAPVKDAVTVGSLCYAELTPADLKELLVRLAVIDTTGKCLTNNLKGKAQGKRGAFTAAYRVLHRAGLLAPTTTDKEWAAAFKKEYEAELGTDVIAHKLTQHGQAPSRAPGPFQQAVTDATEWVSEWKSRRQS